MTYRINTGGHILIIALGPECQTDIPGIIITNIACVSTIIIVIIMVIITIIVVYS